MTPSNVSPDSRGPQEWAEWLESAFRHTPQELAPFRRGPDDLHHAVIEFWQTLPPHERLALAQGAGVLFESTPPAKETVPQIYFLLEILARLKPVRSRPYLFRAVSGRQFRELTFAARSLEELALGLALSYGPDANVVKFAERRLWEADTTETRLRLLRLLSTHEWPSDANLEHVFKFIEPEDSPGLSRLLGTMVRHHGASYLYDWFRRRAKLLQQSHSVAYEALMDACLRTFGRRKADNAAADAHLALLHGLIRSRSESLDPAEIVAIAESVQRVARQDVLYLLMEMKRTQTRWSTMPEQILPPSTYEVVAAASREAHSGSGSSVYLRSTAHSHYAAIQLTPEALLVLEEADLLFEPD